MLDFPAQGAQKSTEAASARARLREKELSIQIPTLDHILFLSFPCVFPFSWLILQSLENEVSSLLISSLHLYAC